MLMEPFVKEFWVFMTLKKESFWIENIVEKEKMLVTCMVIFLLVQCSLSQKKKKKNRPVFFSYYI